MVWIGHLFDFIIAGLLLLGGAGLLIELIIAKGKIK
jgi:hypothetical protein